MEENKLHYACTGECGGTSDVAGSCGTEGCSAIGQPLIECACPDPTHDKGDAMESEAPADNGEVADMGESTEM